MTANDASDHNYRGEYDNLVRFASYFCQIDLVRSLSPRSVLEVGIGSRTVSNYLRQQGFEVTTCDIDASRQPDHVADVRSLPFADGSYDLVMACEVLEHIPWQDVDAATAQLARVSRRHVLISLPYLSLYFEAALRFPLARAVSKTRVWDICLRLPWFFRRCSPSHCWEIGMKGYPLRKVRTLLRRHLNIRREVRPVLNPKQHFFVLEKP